MTISLVRREFLAGAAAVAAFGKRALAAGKADLGVPIAGGRNRLYLPTESGGAAGVKFAASPAWVRDTPGWYVPDTTSAGLGVFDFITHREDRIALKLKSFRDLPILLSEAKSLGTSSIYLVDWYEGLPGARRIDYWQAKGDYIPRSDLGGEAALKEGIAALHAQGGRIIVYVEGFIIGEETSTGKAHGAQWSILRPNGPPARPYPGNWKLCPAAEGFAAYLEGVARRIAGYGMDGIFVDSYGYQMDWECVARPHGHPLGSKEVFNNGAARLMQRVRAAMHSVNPEAIILIEGPKLKGLFAFIDGSLDTGIHGLASHWLWDAQGQTDTVLASWSIDDWHQILAIGAKLACLASFLQAPPHGSATGVLDAFIKRELPDKPKDLYRIAFEALRNLHQWRNAGLILGLSMAPLNEFAGWALSAQNRDPMRDAIKDPGSFHRVLEALRPRAVAIDSALAGRPAPAATAYLKSLLTARAGIAKFIDHGSTVAAVASHFPRAAGWRFTSANGVALTAVSVAEVPRQIVFPDAPGSWRDGVSGDTFTAQGDTLAVTVPAHGIRLLQAA
ncbi:MAG: DUF6259 domain-containing protein [Rhodomicrobium sp.]